MSYLQVTAVRPSLRVSAQYNNTLRGSPIRCNAPLNVSCFHNSTICSLKKCTELMKCRIIERSAVSRHQLCTPVCSFGGKGESKNGNEASPWKSIEKAMSSFKKEQSLEDVLRQQMEKQDYYDGGSGGDPPSGGGGGGGGFGGTEDEGFAGILDEILQVTLAILALIVLYLNIIAGDQVKIFITDIFNFLAGKKGPRMRTIMYEFANFYQKFRARVPYDPYWLEKAIITTSTWYDSPEKYQRILKSVSRATKSSSKPKMDSDSDEKSFSSNTYSDNAYDEDSDNDNDNAYRKKSYNDDDDDDDNAYEDDDF